MSITEDAPDLTDGESDAEQQTPRRSGKTWKPKQKQKTSVEPGLYLDPFQTETVRYWTGTAWAPESIGLSDDPGRPAARELQQRYGSRWHGVLVEPRAADDAEELKKRPPAFTQNRAIAWVVLAVLAITAGYAFNHRNYIGSSAHGGQIAAVIGACYDENLSVIVACGDSDAVWKLVKQAPTCEAPLIARDQAGAGYDSDESCLLRLVPTS
jgi:hypothetical protein